MLQQSFEFSSLLLEALSQVQNALPAINDAVLPAMTMNDNNPGEL